MFKRDILFHLERWKDDTHRKPLILRGARPVSYTHLTLPTILLV